MECTNMPVLDPMSQVLREVLGGEEDEHSPCQLCPPLPPPYSSCILNSSNTTIEGVTIQHCDNTTVNPPVMQSPAVQQEVVSSSDDITFLQELNSTQSSQYLNMEGYGSVDSAQQQQYHHQQQNTFDYRGSSSMDFDSSESFYQRITFKCSFCSYRSLHLRGLTEHMDIHIIQIQPPWFYQSPPNYSLKPPYKRKKEDEPQSPPHTQTSDTQITDTPPFTPTTTINNKDPPSPEDTVTQNTETMDDSYLYSCHLCSFRAKTASEVIGHIKILHENRKPFQCKDCNYSATTEKSLAKHMIRHSSNRKHPCPYCSYSTNSLEHLKNHLRCHTGEKPYKCPYENCSYASAQEVALQIHIRRHTGARPYFCPFCAYKGRQMGHLRKHMKNVHPDLITV